MAAYFARRLLLLIPTFLGITMLVFSITRFVPGGPIDQAVMQMQMGGGGEGGAGAGNSASSVNLDPKAIDALKRHYHFDWPLWKQYLQFLGPINLDEQGWFGDKVDEVELITWEADANVPLDSGASVVRMRMTGPVLADPEAPTPASTSGRAYMPEAGTVTR
ncbi:MAG TPA: hypothetical protein P5218_09235, partial [Planctomycetota bacterium]|nr:hypothetical protein [Planctomycetota bacterium]